ncbi:1-pyrroline-5-carboxylate dehydrogenase [Leptospira yasudae]|uniref:proline dehydrogenase family protein n=1 Tax=Leptospira yasudae TaxID=2202201 RepID=UPI001082AC0F|nr:proline dehydrogenase family protein [Leptospira yasudae]TGK23183.1 1-pyrroline-5-carboxylate dehydrogenase [Leptospira yasudae]TGM00437.1 1-pyrroline-5-carboxylate dehydrogenase [Leptospira yasudae]
MITISSEDLEAETKRLGVRIIEQNERQSSGLFSKQFWIKRLLGLSVRYPKLKIELFRFVDVLPSLRSSKDITDHLSLYLLEGKTEIPKWLGFFLRTGISILPISFVLGNSVRFFVLYASKNFIAGKNFTEAKHRLLSIRKKSRVFTLDILGEAALSEKEALRYQKQYLEVLSDLDSFSGFEQTSYGSCPYVNVSVKCSSLYSQISSLAKENSVSVLKERLRPILRLAKEKNAFINLDAEQFDYKEILMSLAEEIFLEEEFKDYPHFGVVIQAYLKNSKEDLQRIISYSEKRGVPITVRLVKGAYWEYEVIKAKEKGWEIPVFESKAETDLNYEECSRILLESFPNILSAFGSHNIRSLAFVLSFAEKQGLNPRDFEIQMLYGMGDSYKSVLTQLGYRVREYTPLGEILPGMAYLVRRLLENTSNQGFLQNFLTGRIKQTHLLQNPKETIHDKL